MLGDRRRVLHRRFCIVILDFVTLERIKYRACICTTNLTITLPFTLDVTLPASAAITCFSQLPSQLSKGSGNRVPVTAEERDH